MRHYEKNLCIPKLMLTSRLHTSPQEWTSLQPHASCAPLMKWEKLGYLNPVLGELSLPVPHKDVPLGSDSDSLGTHSPCLLSPISLPPHPSPPFCRKGAGNVFFFFPLRSYLQNRRKQEEPFIKEQISMARHFSKQTLPPRRQQALHSCALLSVSPCASSEGTAPAHGNTETFLPTELSTPRGPWPWGNVLAGCMDTGKGDQQ